MYKKVNVVMLPTNEKANLLLTGRNELYYSTIPSVFSLKEDIDRFQHLYILSDEKIKKDDWYIADNKVYGASVDHMPELYTYPCKKIIATTDKSLKLTIDGNRGDLLPDVSFDIDLPQIPQSFIEYFVEQYNKGNIITEVMVEYEPKRWINNPKLTKEQDEQDFDLIKSTEDYDKYLNYGLKINPDNTINIKPIKDSWSKKEQFEKIIKFRDDYEEFKKKCYFGPNKKEIDDWTNNWIEQNF